MPLCCATMVTESNSMAVNNAVFISPAGYFCS
jgi:hypothetical protein